MKIYAKSYQQQTEKIANIKVEAVSYAANKDAQTEAKAVYALLGGYNQVARGVDLEKYNELRTKFDYIVDELAALIEEQR